MHVIQLCNVETEKSKCQAESKKDQEDSKLWEFVFKATIS